MPRHLFALFMLPGVLVFALFFALPAASILLEAGTDAGAAVGRVLADPVFWNGLRGSLLIGTLAPLVSVIIGVMVAISLSRYSPRLRTTTLIAITLPLTFSGLIIAYGFILVFGRAGFVTMLLAELGFDPAQVGRMIYSVFGLGLAYSYYLIPRVVLIVLPAILNFDIMQIAAARSMGASRVRALAGIMLPQIAPSIAVAYALTASVAIGAYGTALALVGTQVNILPLVLYSKISETGTDLPAAAVMSIVLMAICSIIIMLAELVLHRKLGNR